MVPRSFAAVALLCSACAHEPLERTPLLVTDVPPPAPSARAAPFVRSFETKTIGSDPHSASGQGGQSGQGGGARTPSSAPGSATSTTSTPSMTPAARSDAWSPVPVFGDKNPSPPGPGTPQYGDPNPNPPGPGTPRYGHANPAPPGPGTPRSGDPNPSPPGR